MTRMLLTATVPGHIEAFYLPLVKAMTDLGWVVDAASSGPVNCPNVNESHLVDWTRNPLSLGNIRAARQLKEILDANKYELVYCHTPVAAAITRLAARSARAHGTRVVYMGHGFHFFRGAPLSYWMTYFPAEWILSFMTDDVLTINEEDFRRAQRWFHSSVHHTSGVGIDLDHFQAAGRRDADDLRDAAGIAADSKIIMFVGELSKRKNQELLIRALPRALADGVSADVVLVGEGTERESLETLAHCLKVADRVHFLGQRDDVAALVGQADLVTSPAIHEGLPQNVVEAMAMGKPILASPIRGHVDLIEHGVNGFLTQSFDADEWALAIKQILSNPRLAANAGWKASQRAHDFEVSKAVAEIVPILDR